MKNQNTTAVLKIIPYVKSISLSTIPDPHTVSKIKAECKKHHITIQCVINRANLTPQNATKVKEWLS